MKYPPYCCQRCGEPIGYLGRAIDWLTKPIGFTLHGLALRSGCRG